MDKLTELLAEVLAALMLYSAVPLTECYYEGLTMTNAELLDDIIRREGSRVTNHPADRGGLTKYGVTQARWTEYRKRRVWLPESVADITEQHARDFYLSEEIQPIASWLRDEHLVALIVDSSINHGSPRVARWMQLAAEVEPDGRIGPITKAAVNSKSDLVYREVLRTRFRFYAQIASDEIDKPGGDPQAVFLRGWINRACEFVR